MHLQSFEIGTRRSLIFLAWAFLALTQGSWAQSFTDSIQFPSGVSRPDVSLVGAAKTVGDAVQLTDAATFQEGTLVIGSIPPGEVVKKLTVKFEVQTKDGTSPPADGFSFNFGPNLFGSTVGEDGIESGLAVTFDTFDNGGLDTAPAVEVVYDQAVKAGVSVAGTRAGGRSAHYVFAKNGAGANLSLTTGSAFIPVQIDLDVPVEDGGGKVSVMWNGIKILTDVAVPYFPAKGWRIGLGARTGAEYQRQSIRNISIAADTSVKLVVSSEYGDSLLSPVPGSKIYQGGQSVTLDAPDYVYLDRYRKTLYGTEQENQKLAAYRAKRVGGTKNGQPLTPGGTVSLTEDTVVNWKWELEYLAEVNTGTESIQGLSASSVTDSANQPTLGRNFRGVGYNFTSVVYSQIMGVGTGLDVQFQPRGYVIENAPGSPERFLQLSGSGDHLRHDSSGAGLIGGDGAFTFEFWARRDPVAMGADQNVVALGVSLAAGGQLRAGFTAGNAFFLSNNGITVTAPSALTDGSWHHWAAVNDPAANTVTLFRDGKVVAQGNQALNFSGNEVMTVGARANGAAAEGFFPGGVNNVRVWKTALGLDEIRDLRATVQVGPGNPALGVELPFDTLPADLDGVFIERRTGTSQPTSVADTASFPVASSSVQAGFTLPDTATVPAAGPSGYHGWTLRSRLRIEAAGNYNFVMNSGDGGQLFIDGVQMRNTVQQGVDSVNLQASRFLAAGNHIIEVHVYDVGGRALNLRYSSGDAGVTSRELPTSDLIVLARDHLTLGGLTLASAEGGDRSFSAIGFNSVIPASASGAQMAAAVLPGFHFNPLDTTTGTTHNIDPAEQGALTDYRRVFWMWDKKFRFKVLVNAVGLPDTAVSAIANLPYFKTVDGFQDGTTAVKTQPAAGMVSVLDLWLAEGEKLEVGTIYRTADRRHTLKAVSAAMNNFSGISFRSLLNATYKGSAAKATTIPAISGPGSMNLDYGPTTYRAQLPIGQGLDFSSAAAMDVQLTPDLPDEAALVAVTTNSQPAVTGPNVTQDQPGWTGGEGDPWQWDVFGKKWYPLKPGIYTLAWKDKNTGETYSIEVAAEFPDVTESLAFREDAQGNYLGSAPDYRTDFVFAATEASFPATPAAHYRYLVSPNPSAPFPVDLDASATDRWRFLRQAFSEQDTAKVSKTGSVPRFTEISAGVRSVLVFSYRPTTGAASGDMTREKIAVRVVSSLDSENHQNDAPRQVVASRISSSDDSANYGSGYIVNEISNYNGSLYDRTAAVGKWGPVFPVNWAGLFEDEQRLSIGYYEIPGSDPASLVHPPVGWPYVVTHYDEVDFPSAETAPAIYIASQLGSEGVNQSLANPQPQPVFDPAKFANLTVYSQPDRELPGFNPNEEHALVAASNKALMTGDSTANIGQSAFFALQADINRTDPSSPEEYTSEPFVLAQYTDRATGQAAMTAYRVLTTRTGSAAFPARDPKTHLPVDEEGMPVPQPADPTYDFEAVAFAGDIVAPFYPLNLVVGGRILSQNHGGNLVVKGHHDAEIRQQTLWHDKSGVPWVVAGDLEGGAHERIPGRFFYQFWYPLAPDFWLGEGEEAALTGSPVAWLPQNEAGAEIALADFRDGSDAEIQRVRYSAYWKENYPVLKRGETLAYAGGEYKTDDPAAPGLPAVVGWASGEVVFDSATPGMTIHDQDSKHFNARFMRLLDIHSEDYPKEAIPPDLTPANPGKVSVSGSRWYFKDLIGSLGRRFYYDNLEAKLVVRGTLNGRETGDPKLTQTPLSVPLLSPNVLNEHDVEALKNLAPGHVEWAEKIEKLFEKSNPAVGAEEGGALPHTPLGLRRAAPSENQVKFYVASEAEHGTVTEEVETTTFRSLKSLGTGAALVPNPESLTEATGEEKYVTLVENNDPAVNGAVTLHIIRLGDERYRGAIAVVTPQDAFDEKVELVHTGDFGGATEEIYYQWWVHDVAPLDGVGTPDPSSTGWKIHQQGKGLKAIRFTGRPDMTLADKLFFVRSGHERELAAADSAEHVEAGGVLDAAWRLVNPDDRLPEWGKSIGDSRVPYQWSGAANSPQLLASGSRRFLPQLLMGWVKRVLDAVNPYEARFSANFSGDGPASYSSMLVQAGRPYNGPVALNASKDSIENVGLIELYETVLQRARDLTENSADAGTNQALLLASTRLAMLYELLAGEAYTDAQNSSLALASADGSNPALTAANPYVFSFMNEVPSLLQEELSLLRGTDFLKSYPVQNRLFWNYFKGLGEAAYNANYNVSDATQDGLIDENDAAALYPMGHGDAWGHFLSASKMHYGLLRRGNYDWQARSELYSLLGNVIPTDYLDEQSFARTAAAKARAGLSIVKATYRDAYVADPAAQRQGYTDSADPARAWGVSEWASRAGQSSHFDWLVGNAILPAAATKAAGQAAEGLDKIDRETAKADLQALAGSLREIQRTLDGVNQGATPIGLDPDAVSFGLDSFYDGNSWERRTHFEQTYDRAVAAAANAKAALDFVSSSQQNLRQIADDTDSLKKQVILQDIDYRNRLIALLGTPYSGAIGNGRIFQEGYTGPDLLTSMYLDATTVEHLEPKAHTADHLPEAFRNVRIDINANVVGRGQNLDFLGTGGGINEETLGSIFEDFYLSQNQDVSTRGDSPYDRVVINDFSEHTSGVSAGNRLAVEIPISLTSQYAFKAPEGWGRRGSPGEIQTALNELLKAEVAVEAALDDYQVYINKLKNLATYAQWRLFSLDSAQKSRQNYFGLISTANAAKTLFESLVEEVKTTVTLTADAIGVGQEYIPKNINLVGGHVPFSPIVGSLEAAKFGITAPIEGLKSGMEIAAIIAEGTEAQLELLEKNDAEIYSEFNELLELLKEVSNELQEDPAKRLAMADSIQALNIAGDRVRAIESEAQRLIAERSAMNQMVASRAQRNRYGDMVARLSRDETARKYESAMDNAVRYAWLAAKAYDYETSLSPGHPANAATLLEELVRVRQLGQWDANAPKIGNGGLAEVLAKLMANYTSLKGQIGINNPQRENSTLSLRTEGKRILADGNSDSNQKWKSYLASTQVADLSQDKDFARYCRPFASPDGPAQPGFKIVFSSEIHSGRNFFGNALSAADHAYSSANFATKLRSVGVGFSGYDVAADGKQVLAATPRVYFVPAGMDVMRYSDGLVPKTRGWSVVNQRIPVPFPINATQLRDFAFNPAVDSLNGSFAELARLGDFRAYPTAGGILSGGDPVYTDSQLFSRSAWNTRWVLFIPAASLGSDPQKAMKRFMDTVTDIQLQLTTFSSSGM